MYRPTPTTWFVARCSRESVTPGANSQRVLAEVGDGQCARCNRFASAKNIESVNVGASVCLLSKPERRLHLNGSTHACAGTKAATAKPHARTLVSRMCLLLLISMMLQRGFADSQSRPTHCAGTKVATAQPSYRNATVCMWLILRIFLVPQRGFEPLTHALRMRCSTN